MNSTTVYVLQLRSRLWLKSTPPVGTQTQAYSTSPLATLRKSLTLLESAGYDHGYFVLDPTDWEEIELTLASTNAVDYQGIPYVAATRRLFGVRCEPHRGQGFRCARYRYRRHGRPVVGDIERRRLVMNLIRGRCEGRFATSVYAPLGVVVGDLTA